MSALPSDQKTIKRVLHGFPGLTLVHSSSRRLRSRAGAHATRAWRNCCTRRWCSVHAGAFRARLQLHLFRLLLAFVLICPPSSRVPAGAYSQICFRAFGGRIPLLGPPESLFKFLGLPARGFFLLVISPYAPFRGLIPRSVDSAHVPSFVYFRARFN